MKASAKLAITPAYRILATRILATWAVATWILMATAVAQDLENRLFGPAEEARSQAELSDAALLSPKTYLSGSKYFDGARRDFEKGKNLDRIREKLAQASADFSAARSNAELAKLTLTDGIESRAAAQLADAAKLTATDWLTAEKTFNRAALALERGDLKETQKKHAMANTQFRLAELNAIRTRVLAEAWQLIAEADEKKVGKFAPQTLAQAKRIATRTNRLIIEDRYELAQPLVLADRAAYEARHALYIASLARRIKEDTLSIEQLIMNWESPLGDIARAANITPDFSAGPGDTGSEVIGLLEELPGLRADLHDRDALIADLEEEIRELDTSLGGASADRSKLIRRLEQQTRVREQFRQVENMFTSNEAVVLRNGDNLILRLVGLSFASSSTQLGADAERLLAKVQSAIDVFPQCGLTVEGHTDAQGNASRNLELSEQRAQAVKMYMVNTMRIPAFRIAAAGYGDTQPIANNKTNQGRARNRRIDLIIAPNAESL